MLTTEEKYNWVLSKLVITDIDAWEKDALVQLDTSIYFQFWDDTIPFVGSLAVDKAIEWAIKNENKSVHD